MPSTASPISSLRLRPMRRAIRSCAQPAALNWPEQGAQFTWVAYLSTTGVYGDHEGGLGGRGHAAHAQHGTRPDAAGRPRRMASTSGATCRFPIHLFRLAGIYGPGRNAACQRETAAPSASSSRDRCSAASMSRTSPACSTPRWHSPSRPRLQCLRRRGLPAAGCHRPRRRIAGCCPAARHSF